MSKISCVVVVFLVCFLLSLGICLFVTPMSRDVLILEAHSGLMASGRLLQQMDIQDQQKLLDKMAELSQSESFRELYEGNPSSDKPNQDDWLKRLRGKVEELAAKLDSEWSPQDFFLLDRTGLGIVKRGDPVWFGDPPGKHPGILKTVQRASEGQRAFDVVRVDDELLRLAAVPIKESDRVSAILLATFSIDSVLIERYARQLNLQVKDTSSQDDAKLRMGYVVLDGLMAHSFDERMAGVLGGYLEDNRKVISSLLGGSVLQAGVVTQSSVSMMLAGFPLLSQGGVGTAGILVARDVDTLVSSTNSLNTFVVISALLVFVLAVYVVLFWGWKLEALLSRYEHLIKWPETRKVGGSKPKEKDRPKIDKPQRDTQHLPTPEPASMPQSQYARTDDPLSDPIDDMNLVSAEDALPGLPDRDGSNEIPAGAGDKDEQPETSQDLPEQPPAPVDDEEPLQAYSQYSSLSTPEESQPQPNDQGPPDQAQAAFSEGSEPDLDSNVTNRRSQQHYREVYRDFLRAKEKLGERIEKLNFERFVTKLKKQEAMIKDRQGCRRVNFEVIVKNEKVSLRPRIVR